MMKIGIVTPVKADREEKVQWLYEAILSVQAQTHEDWSMVVVNDRSGMKFGDFKDLVYAMKDSRITGIKASDYNVSGVAASRNLAVENSDVEVILPLDSDDLLPEYALQVFDEAWSEKPDGVLYGHTEIRQNNSSRIH
jgi:glycosyltransferase involved in cell wall biosynthesis